MKRKVTVDFYSVQLPKGYEGTFENVLLTAAQRRNRKPVKIGPAVLRIAHWSADEKTYEGNLEVIRMDEGVTVGRTSGGSREVDLEDDEGPQTEAAFRYDDQLNVLCIERNRRASASRLSWFLEHLVGLPAPLELLPCYTKDAMARLKRLGSIQRLEVVLAGDLHPAPGDGRTSSTAMLARLHNEPDASRMDVMWSAGRGKKKGLDVVKAVDLAMKTASLYADQAQKIRVTGRTPAKKRDVLDLIEERMTFIMEFDLGRARYLPYKARRDAVRSALDEQRSSLMAVVRTRR